MGLLAARLACLTDTVAILLEWVMAWMVLHPGIQSKTLASLTFSLSMNMLSFQKKIKFFSTLTKSISNKWKKIHIKYAVRNTL